MTTNRINVDGLLGRNIVSGKVITGEFFIRRKIWQREADILLAAY